MASQLTQFTIDQLLKSSGRAASAARQGLSGAKATQAQLDAMQRAMQERQKLLREKKKRFGTAGGGRGINIEKKK